MKNQQQQQMFVVVTFIVAAICALTVATPLPYFADLIPAPDGGDFLLYDVAAEEPSSAVGQRVVRREAPVYVSKEGKKDLATSATGYGHGGSGYGHGGGGGGYGPTGYVGYGARTGGYGAFSWHSDHPVGGGGGYGYGR